MYLWENTINQLYGGTGMTSHKVFSNRDLFRHHRYYSDAATLTVRSRVLEFVENASVEELRFIEEHLMTDEKRNKQTELRLSI